MSTAKRVTPLRLQVARRKFVDFLRNFRGEPDAESPDGRLIYRDKLDQDQVGAPQPQDEIMKSRLKRTSAIESMGRDVAMLVKYSEEDRTPLHFR